IGRIIEGSPAERSGKLKVGDRILAVNNQSIISMAHADIVKLIKDAGLSVTLRVVTQDESSSTPSAASSEKQSPQAHPSPVAQNNQAETDTPPNTHPSPVNQTTLTNQTTPESQQSQPTQSATAPVQIYTNDGGPAERSGKLKVGDRILAVNNQSIISMAHADIVKLIKDAGLSVTLRVVTQDESSSTPSAASSEKQSPQAHPSPVAQNNQAETDTPPNTHPSPVNQTTLTNQTTPESQQSQPTQSATAPVQIYTNDGG
ncbi:membrane-associated guanylate kinase, WW and PDZ domain-containing protein 2a isoform X1, partial [Tachysurus ichikawai]